jgi:WD40 repeat protein/tRNA A-37 threonylcarbamoyl transferase component Bud32
MSRDQATPQEERFAALLAAFDDALATGAPPPGDTAPDALRPRLEDDLQCLQLLHHLRPTGPAPAPATPAAPAAACGPRYHLVQLHAVGGLGHVWLAHDVDLGRDVALKELRPERAEDAAIAARFLREARITGQLQHPGIVPVYELVPGESSPNEGADAEPPFYTMRFVQGRTLTDAARAYHERRAGGGAGPIDLATLLNAFVSVCNTVAYAHSRGVIHRDLKGQNVVLGDFGEVMVLDWGFAKVLGQPEEDSVLATGPELPLPADHTQVGIVLGTPAYMAPEQAAGRQDPIDCRTDVHGLGAILYEILTGQPPFRGIDTLEVLRKVREEEPPRPETVCSGVPPALAAICRRALARDPERRYTSATDLGRDVQHWMADEPVTAYRERTRARLRRWARRHKPIVAGLAVLVGTGLTALGLGAFLLEQEQSRTTATRAQAAVDKAATEVRARQALETQLYYHRIALAERELAVKNLNRATQLLAACPENRRGWEWYCLQRLCHADVRTLRSPAAVTGIAFSPDGQHLASAGLEPLVRIWDVHTGQLVRPLQGHSDVVYGVAYSPDGSLLATASWDHTVKIWNAALGQEVRTLLGHTKDVWRVAFSPDGRLLASVSKEAVKVWDVATGQEVRTLGPVGGLERYGLAYSPNGQLVAVTMHDQTVILWNVETGEKVQVFRGHTSTVKNVAFSPDGRLVASGAGDLSRSDRGEVKVWESATGREVFHLRSHTDPIFGVAFSPDGQRLVSASQDQTVKIWDVETGQEVLTLRAHADTVRAVAFSPDGWCLATACVDGTIKLWDAASWADEKPVHLVETLAGHGAAVVGVAFHADGRHLAALSDNQMIRTWDVDTGREREDQRLRIDPQIHALALSPDDRLLATATSDGIVWLLDSKNRKVKRTLRGHPNGPVKSLAFSPDGRRLAVAHWDRTAWVWDTETGKLLLTLKGPADSVTGVAFSPDGKWLAAASYDQTVRLWDATAGKQVHTLRGHLSRVFSVAFSPDGQTLASASNDGTVRLWSPTTGELLRTLTGHASGVYGVAFSPNGRILATASNDWTVKLWDPVAGTEISTLRSHTDRVHSVAFSPDGRRLASASSDQTVKIWDVPPENAEAK